ncbi:MAG TPA: hypothetical protein DEH78_03395, partial [Solibacterales bacterium]|nr:hypothetical protein [Bryobacterales bacterium]
MRLSAALLLCVLLPPVFAQAPAAQKKRPAPTAPRPARPAKPKAPEKPPEWKIERLSIEGNRLYTES